MNDLPSQRPHVGAVCKIWVHDESFAKEDVLFNASAFPQFNLLEKPLLELAARPQGVVSKDEQHNKGNQTEEKSFPAAESLLRDGAGHGFVFLARDCDPDTKAKHKNLQLSVSSKIARLYGFKNYMEVSVVPADKAAHSASHVEICFRDVYLTRADLHRMVSGVLLDQALFEGQNLVFLGTIRATVRALYLRGRRIRSGLFASHTRPIFRSESARYVLYIQMSREMWDFDTEGSGEIVFNKVVKTILPELFRRWSDLNARHVVSVVLFTRLDINPGALSGVSNSEEFEHSSGQDFDTPRMRDFYRVVVTEMSSGDWETILFELKKEFKGFLRDILMAASENDETKDAPLKHSGIARRPSPAMEGNILEALSLASSRYSSDWVDPDLLRSGLSIIIISPGPGFFEVDQDMLQLTTENLVKNGVGIDLLCLSEKPLHEVPVFGFRKKPKAFRDGGQGVDRVVPHGHNPKFARPPSINSIDNLEEDHSEISHRHRLQNQGGSIANRWTFVVPQWILVHFWSSLSDNSLENGRTLDSLAGYSFEPKNSHFVPKCRMYEVQMTGIMENEMSNISVPNLHVDKFELREKSLRDSITTRSHRSSFHDSSPGSKYLTQKILKAGHNKLNQKHDLQSQKVFDEIGWMEEYDKMVFLPARKDRRGSMSTAPPLSVDHNGRHGKPLGTRFESESVFAPQSSSPGNSSFLMSNFPGNELLHRSKAQDETARKEPSLKKQDSKESLQSHFRVRSSAPLLPFGGNLRTTGKAVASTQYHTDTVTPTQIQRERSNPSSREGPRQSGPISQQVRSSLSRHTSVSAVDTNAETSRPGSSSRATPMDVPQISSPKPKGKPETKIINVARRADSANNSAAIVPQGSIYDQLADTKPSHILDVLPDSAKILSAWLPRSNASRPGNKLAGMASNLGWAHTFVKPPCEFGIKWKSICSPAMLPLSSDYVPAAELLRSYEENTYKVTIADDELLGNVFLARANLLNAMVSFRLAKGFQILPKASSKLTVNMQHSDIHFGDECFKEDGVTVAMSKGDSVHSLCASGPDIQVTRYRPHDALRTMPASEVSKLTFRYNPYIKTTFSRDYEARDVSISTLPNRLNWSVIDNFLAGYIEDFTESCGFWRARFVLIPVDPPSSARRPLPALAEDSDDEVHIEGIQRLTQLWHSAQFNAAKNQENYANLQKPKDVNPNPLGLEFQTRDVSAVLTAGLHDFLLRDDQHGVTSTQLFSDSEKYRMARIDLKKLAADLQSDKGIKVQDRRWYFRLHRDCFVGLELTSWLLYNFQDVITREEATRVGQSLMEKGLFKHVSGRHKFRDGNFFYAIAAEYRITRSDARGGWFSRKTDKNERTSVPGTPQLGALNEVPATPDLKSGQFEKPAEMDNSESQSQAMSKRPTVRLTSVIQCDVGPRKRSDHPELINLHYARLCNPDSCYHFRLEWMDTTPKLVEDSIASWASTAERYGLKLVQLPVAEACTIIETNPFRSPYIVELAIAPPAAKIEPNSEVPFSPNALSGRSQHFRFHRALLRKFGFVLDIESGSNYPADVNISFSWGPQKLYKYSQYIHRTGVILAEVTDEGKLLLLANRLAANRSTLAREAVKHDKRGETRDERTTPTQAPPPLAQQQQQQQPRSRPTTAIPKRSTLTSPVIRAGSRDSFPTPHASHPHADETKAGQPLTAEQIRDEIEAFCHDSAALSAFYDDFVRKETDRDREKEAGLSSARSTPSLGPWDAGMFASAGTNVMPPRSSRDTHSPLPMLEGDIPKLELPSAMKEETVDTADEGRGESERQAGNIVV